jgi:predicted nuclease of restriction endonuclease-like (RecB) superfamily
MTKKNKSKPVDTRLSRGRSREEGAVFPAAAPAATLPEGYAATLHEIKRHLRGARVRAVLAANTVVLEAYWQVGKVILQRQEEAAWGAKVIDRLSSDLREAFPDMSGLSPRNLLSMKLFAEAFPGDSITKQPVSQLPWGHIIRLLQMVKDPATRDFYIGETLTNGWSRSLLEMQIQNQLHLRAGQAVNNFALTLPTPESDMAAQMFKDPYLFDFIGTADPRREREVEQALVDHVQKFLLELGAGFAFVGRQVHLEFSSTDYYLDLLFYHLTLRRFVVVELKAVPFEPEFVGKLNMYMSAVDDLLRHADDKPTIGLLLCKGKDRIIAEYALRGQAQPIGVADWKQQLTETLPAELKGCLPSVEEIEVELSEAALHDVPDEQGPYDTVREKGPRYGTGGTVVLDAPFDATDGADSPFGKRYGGDVFTLTDAHLTALRNGKTLALDVQNEYVVFLKAQIETEQGGET